MEDTFKIRKDKIKNIAIVFLTIMLVLTFFSNSIMNYSLPEVATQYVQSGTITEKVRGTGTVTADDPYKVVIKESRVIDSVAVKAGDEVTKDQVLFYLEDKESEELEKAQEELDALLFAYAQKILSGDISASSFQNAQTGKEFTISEYQARIQAANDKVTAAQAKLREAQKAYEKASNDVAYWTTIVSNEKSGAGSDVSGNVPTEKTEAEEELEKALAAQKRANDDVTNKKYVVENAQAALDKVKSTTANTISKAELANQLVEANASLTAAKDALETAKAEQAAVIKDVQTELDLGNQNDLINDKQKEVEELRKNSVGAVITAPVDGTVTSIMKTAGETTTPEEEIATIQVAGKGFTVSFSVTNAQAQKVKVGDNAELQNAWWYDDVKATLTKIKPDTDDPGKKKLLVFHVEGSVQSGESLSLSVGQNSASYDTVVPTSAVREDKNGKFILIIEEKSTPFGNRYKARRVDVEVLASDDTQTAVSGELSGYEYVITTSNKPVEAGKQVRLAEN